MQGFATGSSLSGHQGFYLTDLAGTRVSFGIADLLGWIERLRPAAVREVFVQHSDGQVSRPRARSGLQVPMEPEGWSRTWVWRSHRFVAEITKQSRWIAPGGRRAEAGIYLSSESNEFVSLRSTTLPPTQHR